MGDEEQVSLGKADMAKADEAMFVIANTGGKGNMTMEEFAVYFGVKADDVELVAKFDL